MNEQEARIYHSEHLGSDPYQRNLTTSFKKSLDHALLGRTKDTLQGRVALAMVGFTRSGKSTLAKTLQERIPGLIRVETDAIHDIINPMFPELQDDGTISGTGFWLRQVITKQLRADLIHALCQDEWWIVNDSSNLRREERAERLHIPRQFDYRTVLAWLKVPEVVIVERLKATDMELTIRGEKPAYEDLYFGVQKPRFEEPTKDEADLLVTLSNSETAVNVLINAFTSLL